MTNVLLISIGLLWSLVFESFLAPYSGIYLIPSALTAAIFAFSPLRINLINAIIGWLAGVSLMSLWVIWILGWWLFSFNFFLHETFYFSALIAMLYATHANIKI